MKLVAIERTVEENELLLKNLEIRDGILQTINYYKEIGFSPPWIGYCVKKDGIIVGMAGFKGKPLNGKVEIAYATNEPFRGRGIGTEICKLMVQLCQKNKSGNRHYRSNTSGKEFFNKNSREKWL